MKKFLLLSLVLCGCTTPQTMLQNKKTGQVETCGGNVSSSIAGGAIGYHIQKNNDEKCVELLKTQGFEVVGKKI